MIIFLADVTGKQKPQMPVSVLQTTAPHTAGEEQIRGDAFEHEYRFNVKLSKISEAGHEMVELTGDQAKRIRDWTIQGTDEGMIMAANYMEWENTSKSFLEKSDGFAFVTWSGAIKQKPILKFNNFEIDYMILNQSSSIAKRVCRDSKKPAGAFEDNFNINGFERIDQDNYLVLGESRHDSVKYNAHLAIDITNVLEGRYTSFFNRFS